MNPLDAKTLYVKDSEKICEDQRLSKCLKCIKRLQPAFVYVLALHKLVCTWKEWFALLSLVALPQL